eukprot:scaffold128411_cov14-Tisochrysis_lutea.AAC.1
MELLRFRQRVASSWLETLPSQRDLITYVHQSSDAGDRTVSLVKDRLGPCGGLPNQVRQRATSVTFINPCPFVQSAMS